MGAYFCHAVYRESKKNTVSTSEKNKYSIYILARNFAIFYFKSAGYCMQAKLKIDTPNTTYLIKPKQ